MNEEKIIREEQTVNNHNANNTIRQVFDILKVIAKKPYSTIKKYSNEKYFNVGILAIILNSVIFYILTNTILNGILGKVGLSLEKVSDIVDDISSFLATIGMNFEIDTNVGLKIGVIAAIIPFAMAGIIYLMHTVIFKKNINFKKIITVIGISELLYCIGLILTFAVSFISIPLALIILLIATICFLTYLHQAIVEIAEIEQNQLIYTVTLSISVTVIAVVIYAIFIELFEYIVHTI